MLVFFAIFPPDEILSQINDIRSKYDKNYSRLAPHITIIPPFTPKRDLKNGIEDLEKILKILDPFEIAIKGVGNFRKKLNSVCYLDIIDTPNTISLQNVAFEVLESFGAKRKKYSEPDFHITVAKRLSPKKLEAITEEVKNINYTTEFLVKYLAYCVIEKNEPWQIKELIPIGVIRNARNNSK